MHQQASDQVRKDSSGDSFLTTDRHIRVAAFTAGIPSSPRFRIRQYIPYLQQYGITVTEYMARFGSWPPMNKALRPFWLPVTLIDRVPGVMKIVNDLTVADHSPIHFDPQDD